MVRKLFCFGLFFVVALCGCERERSVMTYTEAKAVFVQGMTPADVEKKYGRPTVVPEIPGMVEWHYVPVKEITRGGKGSYSGFVIVFQNGKATEILERETVAR